MWLSWYASCVCPFVPCSLASRVRLEYTAEEIGVAAVHEAMLLLGWPAHPGLAAMFEMDARVLAGASYCDHVCCLSECTAGNAQPHQGTHNPTTTKNHHPTTTTTPPLPHHYQTQAPP